MTDLPVKARGLIMLAFQRLCQLHGEPRRVVHFNKNEDIAVASVCKLQLNLFVKN